MLRIGILFAAIFGLVACSGNQWQKPTEAFATGVTVVAETIPKTIELANEARAKQAEEERRADAIDSTAKPEPLPFLSASAAIVATAEDLETRRLALKGLATYANNIAAVTGNSQRAELDASIIALGKTIQKLPWEALKQTAPVSAIIAAAQTALKALGDVIIQSTIDRELPSILAQGDATVQDLAKLLLEDLRVVEDNIIQARQHYIQAWDHAYFKTRRELGPSELRSEFAVLAEAKRTFADYLATTDAAKTAVEKMRKAHAELLAAASQKSSAPGAELGSFIDSVKQLADFYSAAKAELK